MRATIAPVFVSVPEAAATLGVSRTHLYQLLMTNQLRSVKEGRRRLVDPDSLADYRARRIEQTDGRFRP